MIKYFHSEIDLALYDARRLLAEMLENKDDLNKTDAHDLYEALDELVRQIVVERLA